MSCNIVERPLKDVIPYIQPNCQSLPGEMAMDYARRAYIEFARRSGGLVRTLVYDLQEGVLDYPLDLPKGYKINRVDWVSIEKWGRVKPTFDHDGSQCYGGNSNQNLYKNYSGGAMNGSYGYGPDTWFGICGGYRFHMAGYDCLILHKAPIRDCCNGLSIEVSLIPTQEVCGFDSDFFDRWVEGITYGALARALLLTNTDWYNPELAQAYNKKFIIEIQRARHKFDLNYSRGPMEMQARRFV
jgi:hypothetical protein